MPDTPQTLPIAAELPVVPIRGTVVLPLTVAPLGVSRPMSAEAVNRALAGDRTILLLLQRSEADEPAPSDLHSVGTVAIVRQMAKGANGMRVLVEGIVRAEATAITIENGLILAQVTAKPESSEPSVEVDAHVRRLQELVDRAFSLATGLSPDLKQLVATLDEPLRLA